MQPLGEPLLAELRTSPTPLTTHEVASRLGFGHSRPPDFEVTKALRELLRQGLVEFTRGRWQALEAQAAQRIATKDQLGVPEISLESAQQIGLDWLTIGIAQQGNSTKWVNDLSLDDSRHADSGRWAKFRKLLEYYRQCVRTESGAEASSYLNMVGKQFIYLRQFGPWHPRRGLAWSLNLPVSEYLGQFINHLPRAADDQAMVIGYPLQITRISKDDEPDVVLAYPVFFFHVVCSWSNGALKIAAYEPRPEINLKWLENAFYKNTDKQRNFLSACGLLCARAASDEFQGGEPGSLLQILIVYAVR